MAFQVTKTYGHERGLSCAFRQWRAESHCHYIHGYALSFKFVFEADKLDAKGWVLDFGALKPIREELEQNFDHVLAIAADDPKHEVFFNLAFGGSARVKVFEDGVGCEKFAKYAWHIARRYIGKNHVQDMVDRGLRVVSCECAEHGANSAIYINND